MIDVFAFLDAPIFALRIENATLSIHFKDGAFSGSFTLQTVPRLYELPH